VAFINIFEKHSGAHPGVRKGHARGICARGVFTPSETAKQRFESPLFAGSSELVLRFSMAGGNPEAARQGAWLARHAPGAGYTTARYFGVHSFIADAVGGGTTTFRWELAPVSGERLLTEEERSSLPASFLASRLQRRLKEEGPVAMNWQWTLATDTDAVNDPSLPWPDDRVTLNVGTISITGAGGSACDPVNFDPNRLTAGISPSADPVLALRSAAYAISQGKRLAGQ
jgi:catalase